MTGLLTRFFARFFSLFRRREVRLGFYGPPNSGKTTLANRICKEFAGEELGKTSRIPHETREVKVKEVAIKRGRKTLQFLLIDTPGIATRIDFEEFVKGGLSEEESKTRAKEATKGVIDAIKWLDQVDLVLVVMDATKDPYTQVNLTIVGNLDARKIPLLLVANKLDLRRADAKHILSAFPQYEVVGISAKTGDGMEELYGKLFELRKRLRRRR